MGECRDCGKNLPMPFKCKFCSDSFCSKHRLPENHECQGLEDYKEKKDEESDEITYDAVREGRQHREKNRSIFTRVKAKFHQWKEKITGFFSGRGHSRVRRSPTMHAMSRSFPEVATFTLLGIIFASFVLQQAFPQVARGFVLSPGLALEQPWRIITALFLHAGTGHLFVNSLVLFFFGTELERRVGTSRFLQIFFTSGVIASLGFVAWSNLMGTTVPAVGASGALYGVFATLAIIAPEIRVLAFFIFPMSIRTALVFFAVIDIFLLTGVAPIASAAHLAGLVAGLYFGYRLDQKRKRRRAFPF